MSIEKTNAVDGVAAKSGSPSSMSENCDARGTYLAICRDARGNEIWRDEFKNVVTTVGKNYLLDNGLSGSAFTAAFYLGLISSVGFSAVSASDTMASHAGWLEAGLANAPTYNEAARRTASWAAAAAGSKALSAGLVFTFTGPGTVKGCFLTTVSTKDGTTGTLYSAGLFSGGDQPVTDQSTLTVSYSASL